MADNFDKFDQRTTFRHATDGDPRNVVEQPIDQLVVGQAVLDRDGNHTLQGAVEAVIDQNNRP